MQGHDTRLPKELQQLRSCHAGQVQIRRSLCRSVASVVGNNGNHPLGPASWLLLLSMYVEFFLDQDRCRLQEPKGDFEMSVDASTFIDICVSLHGFKCIYVGLRRLCRFINNQKGGRGCIEVYGHIFWKVLYHDHRNMDIPC